ncbi:MAG: ATP-dependent Clp protease adapter ClpS [Burkholderiales bacterium]|nr:ATP-dependent Clp protease adapter ClpS [Burkholderiales bacterium]
MPKTEKTAPIIENEEELREPPLFKVILLNDDFTPQEFVVEVLQRVFAMPLSEATAVMLHVHIQGSGVCGIFPREIAEIKVSQVVSMARRREHILQCTMEEA